MGGVALVPSSPLPQKMRVNIQEVDNGFIVNLGLKVGWGENTKIASSMEEVLSIISDYLKQ